MTAQARATMGHDDIVRAYCPTDPDEMVAAQHWALRRSLRRRANGVYHLKTCLEANVNAKPQPCSDDCERIQIILAWGEIWQQQHPLPKPEPKPRQLRLAEPASAAAAREARVG